jgi:hypothetical protein
LLRLSKTDLDGNSFTCTQTSHQLDPSNEAVVLQHVMCAAAELPLTPASGGLDAELFGSSLGQAVSSLMAKGLLGRHPRALRPLTSSSHASPTEDILYYTGVSESPTKGVSLRCIDPEQYAIVDEGTGTVLEQIEGRKAFYQVYGERQLILSR